MSAFRFSTEPFEPVALRASLANPAAGGYASFEGWVRNHNDGMAVTRLEYEAFEALALKEGERILAEACRRFPILDAACVHRTGSLAVGELAVWVGVSAHHRDEAFAACRYIIDEVKHRVPIWKKEYYVNGDSGWVNCERCAEHAHEPSPASGRGIERLPPRPSGERAWVRGLEPDYSRQIALKEVGAAGQERLRKARVLVVGAGGLGVPVLSYLAGAGVGTLGIVDGDRLEASNLHRQPLYVLDDVGRPKAELAAARLRALNPAIEVRIHAVRLDADNIGQLLDAYDLAIDCSDNFATKFLLNDACVLAGKPAIFASVYQYEGQLQVYRPEADTACLRCLWPEATRDGLVGNCAEAGVLGPVPGVFGSLQAIEALKLLLDLPGQLRGELLILDLLSLDTRRIRAPRAAPCRSGRCARITTIARPAESETDLEVSFGSLVNAARDGYAIIDIRDDKEVASAPVTGVEHAHIPMSALLEDPRTLDPERRYLLVCSRGARSRATALELRHHGLPRVFSLRGGIAAL
ncbi:MAG TPA: ThiF family adenylyltransferase [Steroidobacteraceae bacterium]|nr:ThiF family adenylyltransferase [Steroidobacteraceae bacterium]